MNRKLQEIINDNKRVYVEKMPRFRLNVNKHNSPEHENKKGEILTNCLYDGLDGWTEVTLKSGTVVDNIVLDVRPPVVYEVLKSETEERFEKKDFMGCKVIKVRI